jgi:hypothetical protein
MIDTGHGPEPRADSRSSVTLLVQQSTPILTRDATRYYGTPAAGGSYRVRIFERDMLPPVVVCTQISAAPEWCISAVAEFLAPLTVARYLPHRLEEPEPVVWLEHYPADPARRQRGAARLDIAQVTFAHWRVSIGSLAGRDSPRIGVPSWTFLSLEDLTRLIGRQYAIEPGREEGRSGSGRPQEPIEK